MARTMPTRTHLHHVSAPERSARLVLQSAPFVPLVGGRGQRSIDSLPRVHCWKHHRCRSHVVHSVRGRSCWLDANPATAMLALALATTPRLALQPVPCARPTGRTMIPIRRHLACRAARVLSGAGSTECSSTDECLAEPCLNGGACFDGADMFFCACPAGYEGPTCAVDTNECAVQPLAQWHLQRVIYRCKRGLGIVPVRLPGWLGWSNLC